MINRDMFKSVGTSLLAAAFLAGTAAARGDVKAVTWSPHAKPSCQMNMGPTGARAWMRGHQFEVVRVDKASPADGILEVGDRVVGAGRTTFSDDRDSRMILGDAIGEAEAKGGDLRLDLLRHGKKRKVTVRLPVTGPFSNTWPYDCSKSQRILHEACMYLREAQFPKGQIVTDGGIGTYLGGLLFLASGDARFRDCARRAAYAVFPVDHEKEHTPNWSAGYGGVLLGEYYLATGDTNVLGQLQEIVDFLEAGQMQCGSWGHDSPSAAYGGMNQVGIVCAMAISLAAECGLKVDQDKLDHALNFYARYAELGAVPYGDHGPGYNRPDDNGKCASSAILCGLHSEMDRASEVFAESVEMSYWMRETGHTGGFFCMFWGPLALRGVDEGKFRSFMDYQSWYYNLSRTWKGSLVMLPYKEALTRFDSATYTEFWGEFTTGGLGLTFAMPHRKLRILGAPRSVFGAKLSGALADARRAYHERDWETFDRAVEEKVLGEDQKRWMLQLKDAKRQLFESTAITLSEIESYTTGRDPYRASEQLKALRMEIGESDPAITNLAAQLNGSVKWQVGPGERYYDAFTTVRSFSFQGWFPYIDTARPIFKDVPRLRPDIWEAVLPAAEEPVQWTVENGSVEGEREFTLGRTDASRLRLLLRAPRNSHTFVSLNGNRVAEVTRGQRGGYAEIPLDNSALSVLKKGRNVLSVKGTSVGAGNNLLDVGLECVWPEYPMGLTPERFLDVADRQPITHPSLSALLDGVREKAPARALEHKSNPGIPERVQVRDSYDRFAATLTEACEAMDDVTLDAALSSPVPYWRHLGSQALAKRGAEGLQTIRLGMKSGDWRVRSAVCDALSSMPKDSRGGAEVHPGDEQEVVKSLTDLLSDDNAWVRARSARALAVIGRKDEAAAAALVRLAADEDAWARSEALGAIGRVSDDPEAALSAAAGALALHSTSYGSRSRALKLIQAHSVRGPEVISSLVFAIENPGEGMGSAVVNGLMKKLVELDPGGDAAIPALLKVAKGGYEFDRLQGNPRKTSIELLGAYGGKAAAALSMLREISGSEEKRNASCRDAAKTAIGLIEAN